MFALAAGKARTGAALGNPVLQTEGRVTFVDGLLATAVLRGRRHAPNAIDSCRSSPVARAVWSSSDGPDDDTNASSPATTRTRFARGLFFTHGVPSRLAHLDSRQARASQAGQALPYFHNTCRATRSRMARLAPAPPPRRRSPRRLVLESVWSVPGGGPRVLPVLISVMAPGRPVFTSTRPCW